MKKLTKTILIVLMTGVLFVNNAYSQFEVGNLLKGGVDDANKLLNEYLEPIGKGWGYDLASGWYNNAKPHGLLGFSLTFTMNLATVPDAAKTFDINDLGLERIKPVDPANTIFPTIVNSEDANKIEIVETVQHGIYSEEITIFGPEEIKGFGITYIPLPALTASVGLIKNTDISLRFIPTIGMGDYGNIGLWGFGVRHDILQWLPIVDKIPFINSSVFLGYSKLNFGFVIPYTLDVDNLNGYVNPKNQSLNAGLGAFHGALLVGVNLPIITPYVSIGLTTSTMNMDVLGEYAIPKPRFNETTQSYETYIDKDDADYMLNDPINLEFKNKLAPSIAAGVRLKFAVITLHGQYTYQEYSTVTAGFGISFR